MLAGIGVHGRHDGRQSSRDLWSRSIRRGTRDDNSGQCPGHRRSTMLRCTALDKLSLRAHWLYTTLFHHRMWQHSINEKNVANRN